MKMLEEEFKVRGEERVMFEELRGSRMDDDQNEGESGECGGYLEEKEQKLSFMRQKNLFEDEEIRIRNGIIL